MGFGLEQSFSCSHASITPSAWVLGGSCAQTTVGMVALQSWDSSPLPQGGVKPSGPGSRMEGLTAQFDMAVNRDGRLVTVSNVRLSCQLLRRRGRKAEERPVDGP